jgi:16S rRNA C967 or C1407 C5-methylase (RsmB/RsmF family)/NOL1/NOP2/fmu family ribosome biogenesis protein
MLPKKDFIDRMRVLLGDEFNAFENSLLEVSPPVSIRLNPSKPNSEYVTDKPVPWCSSGYYLKERPSFTFDPLFHAGTYYVQEASSMFLEQVIKTHVTTPVRCLDLCAAPGGKSTHLCSLLPEGSMLAANEVIRSRCRILEENIIKWGNPSTVICNNDPEEVGRLTHFFDVIVADMPCSGEGMFRKDKASADEWSTDNVRLCAARQRRIVRDVWEALRPGGLFIYSTCTYNTEENEDNVQHIINEYGAESLPVPVRDEWNICGSVSHQLFAYRFFPHRICGEGFFLAVMRKPEGREKSILKPAKRKNIESAANNRLGEWLSSPENYALIKNGDRYSAVLDSHLSETERLMAELRVLSVGIPVGEVKGKDIIPSHAAAMSDILREDAFDIIELPYKDAITYLRRESLQGFDGKGYAIVAYKGRPLGFIKRIGSRANNLYPSEWRIRSQGHF